MPAAAQALLLGEREGGADLAGRLGLAIVAEVTRLHGVAISVTASGAGTCIGLSFPAVARSPAPIG